MTVNITSMPMETEPVPDAGLGALTTERGNLPLRAVDVHAAITGLAAGVHVVQEFHNPYDLPLEATYVFPLPDRAAVTAMRMEAADRVVEGVLKERGQARADYDAAIAGGQRAAIAEEDRPDVFTMRVGNILPGERVTVRLGLSQPLPCEYVPYTGDGPDSAAGTARGTARGTATFRFPLVVAPRYIPGAPLPGAPAGDGVASDTDTVPDASRISPPVLLPGFPDPVRLSLTVEIDPAGLPLTGLESSLHVITADEGPDGGDEARAGGPSAPVRVRLQPGERLNRDFILRLGFEAGESSALTLVPDTQPEPDANADADAESGTRSGSGSGAGSGEQEGTFTLTVLPSGRALPRPRDVVLVLDRSGSMGGWKMVAARRAAARIVDTLTSADRFAVLSFDDRVEWPAGLPEGLVGATDRNRFRAVEHLARLEARWGTEMLEPMRQAAALLDDMERDRVLVLITDGQVGNEDEILARISPALGGVRVHTVGIDQAINAGFLGRLSMIGQGRFELVESEDRLDDAMEHIHHRIAAPLVTGLALDASGVEIVPDTVAPSRLGALFPGVPLVVSGRYRTRPSPGSGSGSGPGTAGSITVRGIRGDGTAWEHTVPGSRSAGRAAVDIWARGHLRDLEDRYVVEPSDSLEERIVAASLRFGVLCRFTAFVAVDSRVVTDGDAPHRVNQPVEAPAGWPGSAVPAGPVTPDAARLMALPPMPVAAPPPQAMPTPPGGGLPAPRPAAPASEASRTAPSRPFFGRRAAPGTTAGATAPDAGGAGPWPGSPVPPSGPVPPAPVAPWPVAPGPVPVAPGFAPPPGSALAEVRELLAEELRRMAGAVPMPERPTYLSDLRTRLSALLLQLAGAGVPPQVYASLTSLAEDLAAADDLARRSEMPALWDHVVGVLTDFVAASRPVTGEASHEPAERPSPEPRRFWKRNH